ncbi:metallophosphoesterase family protein [Kitasatospora sp. NPDC053057]|uniref:metallophosphoesterase family protein n=1 Tax=Kitasatospora sp. NPDC053057 TaxID=3364062 RepID=UPI0037C53271
MSGTLWAFSDLHVNHPLNRQLVEGLRPESDQDWLIVAGDVSETVAEVERTLELLSRRFAKVLWAPGNHELWTPAGDPCTLRGEERYRHLVELCRGLGVVTPEDPYPVWQGADGPAVLAPLFLLYDYTFRPKGAATKEEALAVAHEAGVVCSDEFMLHPDPYPSRDAWCRARVAATEHRLSTELGDLPSVLINHFPLLRQPTNLLTHPEFAQWCGTELTADWHLRFRARAVVYGHLHIPRTTHHDGVRFEEVSIGYPREQRRRGGLIRGVLRQVLPTPPDPDRW